MIRYTIEDETRRQAEGVVTVNIQGAPDGPVAGNDFFSFTTDTGKNVLHVTANDYDPDGDPITITGFPTLPAAPSTSRQTSSPSA